MLFASTELVARIERAECSLLTDGAASTGRRHPNIEVFTREISGGVATHAGPDSPLNKVAGLGFDGSVDEAELEAIEQIFHHRDTPVQVELSCLADPGIGGMLSDRGYRLVGFENVLGCPLTPDRQAPSTPDIEIVATADDDLAAWVDVVVTGFATPDTEGVASPEEFPREALERVLGDMASSTGFSRYLARRGGEIAGGGSLRQSEGIAQLCGASTLPAHRRRGVQTALLHTRLALAAQSGCDLAIMTTLPGSRSQKNAQRRGFQLLYTRAILQRSPGGDRTL
ncbi:MAG: GNAT family N-acetyltransferase [Myxococcota bacterium]